MRKMTTTTTLSLALGALLALPAAVSAAPAQAGIDHANSNSALLRCGTREAPVSKN